MMKEFFLMMERVCLNISGVVQCDDVAENRARYT